MYLNNLTRIFKKNLILIFSIPIVLNYVINLITNSNFLNNFNIVKLVSFILGTIFFLNLSQMLNKIFAFGGKALSLVYFLSSFFVFDVIFLFITKNISFKYNIIFISSIWIVLFLYKSKNLIDLFKISFLFFVYRIFNFFFIDNLVNNSTYKELNTDVPVQWFKLSSLIYENNYFFALQNNLIPGQGLLPSYIQALLLQIGFNTEIFQFIQINSYLFLSFSILFITDLKISKKNKILTSLTLTTFLFNNDWLKYLLINSLMIEGIVSFFIGVLIFNYLRMSKIQNLKSFFFFLTFGGMVLTKNFISLISLIVIISSIFFIKRNYYILAGFLVFGANLAYQNIYFLSYQNFAYTSEIPFRDLLFDLLFFRNLDFINIYDIINQLLIDKPISYLIFIFLSVNLIDILNNKKQFSQEIFILLFVLTNYVLINLLYISYWKNVEIESSYRYFISCFHLIFSSLIIHLSKFEKIK